MPDPSRTSAEPVLLAHSRNYKAEAEMPGTGERAPCPMCGCGVEHADSYQLYTCCNEEW